MPTIKPETPRDESAVAELSPIERGVLDRYVFGSETRAVVARALRISPGEVERIAWRIEPVACPALRIEPDGASVRAARDSGLRIDRIAARSGLTRSKVRTLFAEEAGVGIETTYTGIGRRYSEARAGEEAAVLSDDIRAVRATGKVSGDQSILDAARKRHAARVAREARKSAKSAK